MNAHQRLRRSAIGLSLLTFPRLPSGHWHRPRQQAVGQTRTALPCEARWAETPNAAVQPLPRERCPSPSPPSPPHRASPVAGCCRCCCPRSWPGPVATAGGTSPSAWLSRQRRVCRGPEGHRAARSSSPDDPVCIGGGEGSGHSCAPPACPSKLSSMIITQ